MPATRQSCVIEESGHSVPDGELDLIRIPPSSAEAYHVELARGQRFRFAIAASGVLTVRLANPDDDDPGATVTAQYPAFDSVDLHHFTFRALRDGGYVVTLENAALEPVDVAVFFRTLPPTWARRRGKRRGTKRKVA